MATIHEHGSSALHYSNTWKSSLRVFLQPKEKKKKTPMSAQAVNSMDFWNRNLDKSPLYFCKGQSKNAIAVMHLYFRKAFWPSSLNIHFKNHFGWKLGDWLGTQKVAVQGVCEQEWWQQSFSGIWGGSGGIWGFNCLGIAAVMFPKIHKTEKIK